MLSGGFGAANLISSTHTLYLFYTDPGYGTLIWQLCLAGVFGAMFYLRRLKDLLSRRKGSDDQKQ